MSAPPERGPLRLNRFLARAGLGSRRGVEELVLAGRVTINGRPASGLGDRVDPEKDRVEVDGRPVALPRRWRVYAFNKPKGVVSTFKPGAGRTGLLELRRQAGLPEGIVPVGRLDADTTGLLLWTDDGLLAQALMRPDSRVWKRYVALLDKPLGPPEIAALEKGRLVLDGRPCLPARVERQRGAEGRRWALELHEGRYRQVRRMLELVERRVVELERVAVGPVALGRLRPGDFRRLRADEVEALRRAAGLG